MEEGRRNSVLIQPVEIYCMLSRYRLRQIRTNRCLLECLFPATFFFQPQKSVLFLQRRNGVCLCVRPVTKSTIVYYEQTAGPRRANLCTNRVVVQ